MKTCCEGIDNVLSSADATLDCITDEYRDHVCGDEKLLVNRIFSLRLVRGGAGSLREWVKFKRVTGLMGGVAGAKQDEADKPEEQKPEDNKLGVKGDKTDEEVDKPEVNAKVSDANGEKKVVTQAKRCQQAGGAGGAKPASEGSSLHAAGARSDAMRLRTYIAMVGQRTGCSKSGYGDGAPSRIFRCLQTVDSFSEVEKEIKAAQTKHQLMCVSQRWKPMKIAITDLQSMVRAAESRVQKGLEAAKKEKLAKDSATLSSIELNVFNQV